MFRSIFLKGSALLSFRIRRKRMSPQVAPLRINRNTLVVIQPESVYEKSCTAILNEVKDP